MKPREPEGFALLGVLWIIVSFSSSALIVSLAAREALSLAETQTVARRSHWAAEACASRARADIARALAEQPERAAENWRILDRALARSSYFASDCSALARGAGKRLALVTATSEELARLPGMSNELLDRILTLQREERWPSDLIELHRGLSTVASSILSENYADFARSATLDPDAWLVTTSAQGPVGTSPVIINMYMVRAGQRAALLRRRSHW